MRQIFLDTETTGLNPATGDRIVEIGCVESIDRRFTGRNLHFYLNPERPSDPGALAVHGLTEEFLSTKPKFAEVVDELLRYLKGAELVIHNAAFDVSFLDQELRRLGRPSMVLTAGSVTDSLNLAREQFPGKANSLDALCRRLQVDNSSRELHGALLDAKLLAEVYIRLTRGQESLVMGAHEAESSTSIEYQAPLAAFDLPVIMASAEELEQHERMLEEIDKESGGTPVWRQEPVRALEAGAQD